MTIKKAVKKATPKKAKVVKKYFGYNPEYFGQVVEGNNYQQYFATKEEVVEAWMTELEADNWYGDSLAVGEVIATYKKKLPIKYDHMEVAFDKVLV